MNQVLAIRYLYMAEIVDDALQVLRDASPVGSAGDRHPGLYRDSHMVFIDGHNVPDASNWQPGQQVNISNPEPYSRKIEVGSMKMSVPGHVYENAAVVLASKYGNSVDIKFVYMPVQFGNVAAYASFSRRQKTGQKLNDKARADWLSRQPALQINAR
jgi:hypothetical protein